jgi:hypothetical protein
MVKDQQDGNRKRKRIPSEAMDFIDKLERVLEIRFLSSESLSSHFDMTAEAPSRVTHNSSETMMSNVTTAYENDTNHPFSGAMELIAKGLENVDAATRRQSIDPIWKSLESLDAVAMLDLKQTDNGARVSDGYVTTL